MLGIRAWSVRVTDPVGSILLVDNYVCQATA
jgi:hypothetical protein